MKTTKEFGLNFRDAEGWGMDYLQVCVHAELQEGKIQIELEFSRGREDSSVEEGKEESETYMGLHELTQCVDLTRLKEYIKDTFPLLEEFELAELESEVLGRKIKTEEGIAKLVAQGWQLFHYREFFKGNLTNICRLIFEPDVDLSRWNRKKFTSRVGTNGELIRGKEARAFWDWWTSGAVRLSYFF